MTNGPATETPRITVTSSVRSGTARAGPDAWVRAYDASEPRSWVSDVGEGIRYRLAVAGIDISTGYPSAALLVAAKRFRKAGEDPVAIGLLYLTERDLGESGLVAEEFFDALRARGGVRSAINIYTHKKAKRLGKTLVGVIRGLPEPVYQVLPIRREGLWTARIDPARGSYRVARYRPHASRRS